MSRERRFGLVSGIGDIEPTMVPALKFFLCFFLWEAGANIGPGDAAFHTVVPRRLNVSRSIERARRYSYKIIVVVLKKKRAAAFRAEASGCDGRRAIDTRVRFGPAELVSTRLHQYGKSASRRTFAHVAVTVT